MRSCSRCGAEKPPSEFYYRKDGRPNGNQCKRCTITVNNAYQLTNRERASELQRRWNLNHKYALTPEEFDHLLIEQSGGCAICERRPAEGDRYSYLAVDHDHVSGLVRGLLCNNCNRGIGMLGDTVQDIERAVDYLEGARS